MLSKMKKFGFRTKEGLVAEAVETRYFFAFCAMPRGSPAVKVPRVPVFGNGAGEAQRGNARMINDAVTGIRHCQHVAGLDALPAADGGAVETDAFGESFLDSSPMGMVKFARPEGVHELNVTIFAPAFFCQFNYALGCAHVLLSCFFLLLVVVVGLWGGSKLRFPLFPRCEANGFFDVEIKTFFIANFAVRDDLMIGVHRSFRVFGPHNQINFDLRQKIHVYSLPR